MAQHTVVPARGANSATALKALETEGIDFVGTLNHAALPIGRRNGAGSLLVKVSPKGVVVQIGRLSSWFGRPSCCFSRP